MRVGIDGRALAAEARSGVEWYVVHLLRALARLPQAPEIIAYADREVRDPEAASAVRSVVVRARRGWLRAALPWRLWRDRVEVAHFPSTILPPLLPCPAVVTVHDLAWERFPETYETADLAMQQRAVCIAARRAARLITVSESTAQDLRERYPEAGPRIRVTPLGVSPAFSPEGQPLDPQALPAAQCLAGGYLLYAGRLHPRKNLGRLLEAYRLLLRHADAPPLALAGTPSPHGEELAAAVARLGLADRVLFLGYVAPELLPQLYRGAALFAYPSLYEGFGLPVLEAMASGVPVVASRVPSLAEVAGEAALLVDPVSPDEMAAAMARLLAEPELRAELIRRGLARSRAYTWERTARLTLAVYREVGGERAP